MTKEEWLDAYDKALPQFQWFIDEYFPGAMERLKVFREFSRFVKLRSWLQTIWFELPDNKFNIIENPKGWAEFISLLEEDITP